MTAEPANARYGFTAPDLRRSSNKMMIIRTSATLHETIHVAPASSLPLSSNPYSDWSARLFTADRAQYILVTNTSSLYAVLMHGRGITDDSNFIQRTITAMREQLAEDALSFLFERLVAPETALPRRQKTSCQHGVHGRLASWPP